MPVNLVPQMMLMPLLYETRPSWLKSWKLEAGCPLLVLHHMAPRTGGCHQRLVTGTVTAHM